MVTTALNTEAGPNVLEKHRLPRVWAIHANKMKGRLLQFLKNTQGEVKETLRPEVHLERRKFKTSFVTESDLATNIIVGIAFINNSILKISFKTSTLMLTGSSTVAMKKRVSTAIYVVAYVKSKQGQYDSESYKHSCAVVCHRIVFLISEICLRVSSSAQG